jgi:type I restriction enzyme M protein
MSPAKKGREPEPEMDPALRDTENVPLSEDVENYLDREVRPQIEGAVCDDHAGTVGYEIPFTRLFYRSLRDGFRAG